MVSRYRFKKGYKRFRKNYTIRSNTVGVAPIASTRPVNVRLHVPINRHQLHYFKRTVSEKIPVYDWTVPQNYGHAFKLSELPNYSEFTLLFDQYKIVGVQTKFIFDANCAQVPTTANALGPSLPNLITVNDYDDATPLIIDTDYQQYETYKIARMDRPIKRYCKPKVATAVYNGTFTGYAQSSPWIDANSANVEWYGLKYSIDPVNTHSGANTIGFCTILRTYYIVCRDTR